ncbi:alpha/beta hydrolase [Flavobacterium cheongpyeongense]|uniref:Alpha/beta hydrolase n=1 Tax=Flavobacterium cheongpyeongense TaxID=2212651 RepID=A0A2V4C5N4_9FLAO|nr:alpha/beta hydrolase [Flavobacterium cheongpyeongense]PXY41514.1 alpha/beta hydrolase [Flavobacterium cheongpyeongense]
MKPRLLILSDVFGGKNPEWVKLYIDLLELKFDIQYYDVLELANITVLDFTEMDIHNQFLNGGIDKAVHNLLELEKDEVAVLGFSIGGTIAWKASLKGLKASYLIAVSSTRLRYETHLPDCKIKLYFGDKDLNLPDLKWFSDMKVSRHFFENQAHQLYLDQNNVAVICNEFL